MFEIMRTTRSMRRLKPDPVPISLLDKVLEAGTFAANGGNMQSWRFLVIRDPAIKAAAAIWYRKAWHEVVGPRIVRADRHREPHRSVSPVCSQRPNIWLTISTKRRSGSCPVWLDLADQVHRSFQRCRTCSWPRARWGWAQR